MNCCVGRLVFFKPAQLGKQNAGFKNGIRPTVVLCSAGFKNRIRPTVVLYSAGFKNEIRLMVVLYSAGFKNGIRPWGGSLRITYPER